MRHDDVGERFADHVNNNPLKDGFYKQCQESGRLVPNGCYRGEIPTEGTKECICPWCGHEQQLDLHGHPGQCMTICEECEKDFYAEIDYTPTYSTSREPKKYE